MVKRGFHDARIHLRRSSDNGITWNNPICCIPGKGYYVTNNDRVVRLSSGRIIAPASFHIMQGDTINKKSIVMFFMSDDDGYTWKEPQNYCSLPSTELSGLQEPGVIELKNGVLWAWCRTMLGRQYQMFSFDMGETWTPVYPSVFTSPNSPLSMKRIPGSGKLIAVWNPIPAYQTRVIPSYNNRKGWDRKPLVGAISEDDGKVWSECFTIEGEENRGGYCYCAIHFTDDALLLAYCAGEPEDASCLAKLRIRRIPFEDIPCVY